MTQALLMQGAQPFVRLSTNPEDPWQDYAELRLAIRNPDGSTEAAKSINWEHVGPEECGYVEPLMIISLKTPEGLASLRRLMDQLWDMGIRPTEHGSPGQLKATEAHLEDMRRLVAKAYDAPLKPTSSI